METGLLQTELGVLTLIFITILVLGITFGMMNVNALKQLKQEDQIRVKDAGVDPLFSGNIPSIADKFETDSYFEDSVRNFSGKGKNKVMHENVVVSAKFKITHKDINEIKVSPPITTIADYISVIKTGEDTTGNIYTPDDLSMINPLFYMGLYGCNTELSMTSPNSIKDQAFVLQNQLFVNPHNTTLDTKGVLSSDFEVGAVVISDTKDGGTYEVTAYIPLSESKFNAVPHFSYLGVVFASKEITNTVGYTADKDITINVNMHYISDK